MSNVELLSYRHEYDIRNATVSALCASATGPAADLARDERFVSMADMHQAGMQWTITPENWSGRVEVISSLDGRVTNRGVARYASSREAPRPRLPRTFGPETIALEVRTRQSRIYVAEAARTRVYGEEGPLDLDRSLYQMQDYIHQVLSFEVREEGPCASRRWSPSTPRATPP